MKRLHLFLAIILQSATHSIYTAHRLPLSLLNPRALTTTHMLSQRSFSGAAYQYTQLPPYPTSAKIRRATVSKFSAIALVPTLLGAMADVALGDEMAVVWVGAAYGCVFGAMIGGQEHYLAYNKIPEKQMFDVVKAYCDLEKKAQQISSATLFDIAYKNARDQNALIDAVKKTLTGSSCAYVVALASWEDMHNSFTHILEDATKLVVKHHELYDQVPEAFKISLNPILISNSHKAIKQLKAAMETFNKQS